LEKSLLPLIDEQDRLIENLLGDQNLIFQQDNTPIHTSKKTSIFLEQNGLKTLSWPANSPCLNPIENLWHILKRGIWKKWYTQRHHYSRAVTSYDLKKLCQDAWMTLDSGILKLLLESMPKRVQAVISADGGHIKY
jgi:hypothetical protein